MGTFRVEVQATGNHGCQREKKSGAVLDQDCGAPNCVDCITRRYIKALRDAGAYFSTTGNIECVAYGKLTHWPYGYGTVVDDLLTGVRTGSF